MKEIYDFLRELRENNDREWFNAHKKRYVELKAWFDEWVGKLIEKTAGFDEEIEGLNVKDCVYRIYRDVRFSPDKSPYKTHFAAYLASPGGRNSQRAGYYVHLEPDGSLLGGGLYCPEPSLLKKLRQDIYGNIEEFTSILEEKEFAAEFAGIDATDKLKKVPAPFPSDFPQGDLLKYKHYDIVTYKPDSFFTEKDAQAKIVDVIQKMYRFNRFLNYTVDEMNA